MENKESIDYQEEFYYLLANIAVYTITAISLSILLGVLLGNIIFFTFVSLPLYLIWRYLVNRYRGRIK